MFDVRAIFTHAALFYLIKKKKLTRTSKTYNEIKYIATAEMRQQRIANYCEPDTKILKNIETSHITYTNASHIIHIYYRNDVI